MTRTALRVGLLLLPALLVGLACSVANFYRGRPAYLSASAPATDAAEQTPGRFDTEAYDRIYENPFLAAADNPLSTFGIDVDSASYSNVRRFLAEGRLPPADAVRIEELVNYFDYHYPQPRGEAPFAVVSELSECPWQPGHQLLMIGLKGRALEPRQLPPRNLVLLADVSGSMSAADKLPLLKRALRLLVKQLGEQDSVALVVYAGASGLVLPPTRGDRQQEILDALERLEAGGSTNGGAGIELAYRVARENYRPGGINRVILATDGDFNVGVTSRGELLRLIERERQGGVFLTVLGLGTGNLKDSTMEQLADRGNGNYAYLDSLAEARKVLVHEAGGTLVTIAKDVKIQVEFNPARVAAYRLIGYENRLLRAEDFADDSKDAGDLGAGHTVTALYEIVPAGSGAAGAQHPLRYQKSRELSAAADSRELATIKLRYKEPAGQQSRLLSRVVDAEACELRLASSELHHAAAVAAFGMLLRESRHRGQATFELVRELARRGRADDPRGLRREFLQLVERAAELAGQRRRG